MKKDFAMFVLMCVMYFAYMAMTTGCASTAQKLTKHNSPLMRVMIDASVMRPEQYVRLQNSLARSGKWILVDRSRGFHVIKQEQELQHRNQSDRFEDSEKYAHWGKLYGVGAVIVPNADCERMTNFFSGYFNRCRQTLSIINANTGEIMATSDVSADSEPGWEAIPSWDIAVEELNAHFPERLDTRVDQELVEYKKLSKEEAEKRRGIAVKNSDGE